MKQRGHGDSQMPIWGDYFMADAMEDRGMHSVDAVEIVSGRILSLVYYIQSIQE